MNGELRNFDAAYYQRYYLNPRTRVADPDYYQRLAGFVAAYCRLLDVRVKSILDLGCGTGAMQKPLLTEFRGASYQGIEFSAYACEQYGWTQGCASNYSTGSAFDLVVCHDVLQYLDDEAAAAALLNFAELTHSILYFSVLTREDWEINVDQDLTDDAVHLRTASWYRKRLKNQFKNLGGGVYLALDNDAVVYALEGSF
ncbi:MAG: class I SAM-dependent methyltransferase [Gammaproteobacteria bacterium]